MKILDLARAGLERKAVSSIVAPSFSGGFSGWLGRLSSAGRDYRSLAGDVYDNSVVLMGVYWLAEKSLQTELRLERQEGGDWTPAPNSERVLRPFLEPNQDYGYETLMGAMALSLTVNGNGYLLPRRDLLNRIAGLWYAPNAQIKVRSDVDVFGQATDGSRHIGRYEFTPLGGGSMQPLAPSDVLHLRTPVPDPRMPAMGLSRLAAVLRSVVTDNEADTYMSALLLNMGVPGIAMIPKLSEAAGSWTPDKKQVLKDRWQEIRGELAGMPFLAPTDLTIQQLSVTPEQMALDKLRSIPTKRICGAMKISDIVLGIDDGSSKTYANAAEAREAAVEDALLPHLALISKGFTSFARQERLIDQAHRIAFDLGAYRELQEDLDALHERVRADWEAGMVTLNEARRKLGLPDDPRGDFYKTDVQTGSPNETEKRKKVADLKRRLWAGKDDDAQEA